MSEQIAKYVIGIDLGTTNTVLAYSPLQGDSPEISLLSIPQFVAAGTVEDRDALPSFLYLGTEEDRAAFVNNPVVLSDSNIICGEFARRRSAEVPERTVAAAKSWLANRKVDRHASILPWNTDAAEKKVSPVDASRRYLEYLVATWNHTFPDALFSEQLVVLTVPASFDESARELTREAALAAGFREESLLFLEEPLAAIYSWLENVGDRWRKELKVNDVLLICDVGGGTTDLSLIRVEEENGDLMLNRLAVGNHLLIGGDNMDLALAYKAADAFSKEGVKLDPWQSISLWHRCRAAKETLLGQEVCVNGSAISSDTQAALLVSTTKTTTESSPETFTISIPGRSRRLIGGAVSIDFSRSLAIQTLLDGFFPICETTDKPVRRSALGLREIGLSFEQDTSITRHIASFLQKQASSTDASTSSRSNGLRPTHFLLNGGVFKAPAIQERLLEQFHHWYPDQPPQNLFAAADLDHSVAKGAAYYRFLKEKGALRIRNASARSYYVGIESAGLAIPGMPRPMKALCVAPMGMEEGSFCDVPSAEFGLIVGEPAVFRFFCSTVRPSDTPGILLDQSHIDSFNHDDEADLQETDPIETTLTASLSTSSTVDSKNSQNDSFPADDITSSRSAASSLTESDIEEEYVPIRFQTKITELGVMEIWCCDTQSDRRWKLEFSVRDEGK